MATWPYDDCEVVVSEGSYRLAREGDNVVRSPLQSGLIRQKAVNTRPRRILSVRVDVPLDRETEFFQFIDGHGTSGFMFRKPNSSDEEEWRIVGGEVSLSLASDRMQVTRNGASEWKRYLTGTITMEAY